MLESLQSHYAGVLAEPLMLESLFFSAIWFVEFFLHLKEDEQTTTKRTKNNS